MFAQTEASAAVPGPLSDHHCLVFAQTVISPTVTSPDLPHPQYICLKALSGVSLHACMLCNQRFEATTETVKHFQTHAA